MPLWCNIRVLWSRITERWWLIDEFHRAEFWNRPLHVSGASAEAGFHQTLTHCTQTQRSHLLKIYSESQMRKTTWELCTTDNVKFVIRIYIVDVWTADSLREWDSTWKMVQTLTVTPETVMDSNDTPLCLFHAVCQWFSSAWKKGKPTAITVATVAIVWKQSRFSGHVSPQSSINQTDSGVLGPMLILLNKTILIFFYIDQLSGPIFSNHRFYFVQIDLKMDGYALALMRRPPSVCSHHPGLTRWLRPKTLSDWLHVTSKSLSALNNLSLQSNQELKLSN